MKRYFRLETRWLALVVDPTEERALDDALLDAGHSLVEALRWQDVRTGLYDLRLGAGALEALATRVLRTRPVRLLAVEGLVPFEWSSRFGSSTLEAAMARLPGFTPTERGPWRFFGQAGLSASFEAPGLSVFGAVSEADWAAWLAAFEREARGWPVRWA